MKIKDIALSAAYVGQRVVKAIAVGAQEIWSAVKYIVFADPVVAQICATNFGDGTGLTEEDAAKITDIGTVFKGNTEITSFDELEKFTGLIEVPNYCFDGAANLSSLKLPPSIKNIGVGAIANNSIRSLLIPQSVESIGSSAFYGCSKLVTINIPSSVTSIKGQTFGQCTSLRTVSIDEDSQLTSIEGQAFKSTLIESIFIPSGVTSIDGQSFNSCSELVSIDIRNVSSLGDSVFQGCRKLEVANINGNITHIQSTLFDGCHSLHTTSIPESVISIGFAAYNNCQSLPRISLPSSLTTIADRAFDYCGKLKTVLCNPVTPPSIGSNVFRNTASDLSIYVPDQSVQAYRETSGWLDYADRIWPMEAYLYGIITFADPSVEAICLANWDTNGSGYISKEEAKAVTDIGEVFKGNTEITSFNELLDFTGISGVPQSAFANCENLREISIPFVTNLGPVCFYHCSSLMNIYMYNDTPPYVGYSVFDGARDAVVYVPDDSIEAYKNADTWKDYARRVLGMSNRDRLITDNYTKNTGQSYGNVGGNITFTTDITFEWAKIPIGEVEAVVIRSTDAIPSSLIQYVDSNGKILHRDATDNPYAVSRYVIANIEGATHVYVSSAAGTMRIYGKP